MTPKRSPHVLPFLPGVSQLLPSFGVPSQVCQKDSQNSPERKSFTQEYLETNYLKEAWTHGYTDGSAENAVRNGRAGVYIQYTGGKEDKISLATGLYSTNYKAEADALKTAAAHTEVSTHVFFPQCCPPYGRLVHPAGPPVKQGHGTQRPVFCSCLTL